MKNEEMEENESPVGDQNDFDPIVSLHQKFSDIAENEIPVAEKKDPAPKKKKKEE